jgi:hypothetical protein
MCEPVASSRSQRVSKTHTHNALLLGIARSRIHTLARERERGREENRGAATTSNNAHCMLCESGKINVLFDSIEMSC